RSRIRRATSRWSSAPGRPRARCGPRCVRHRTWAPRSCERPSSRPDVHGAAAAHNLMQPVVALILPRDLMQLTVAVNEDQATLDPPTPRPKGRRNQVLLLLAIAAAVGVAVFWFLRHGRESTDDAQIDADVVLVPTRVDGVVKKVSFVENQRVKAGDVLAELDDATLVARLAQAEATLARATAQAQAAEADAELAERNPGGNKS